ncbi:hypothetical protein T02_4371 [Trichinella nativa]|uniref:Uncharacterized protein n=2 Tax=Trichinella TaxID=6333 RepID=A0A0V1L648_9BILA|nr:hypothetical protein T05_5773 [Trichinella murrelli]KRX56831.1 hypothetical protein T09_15506 [Trichinella sp. T9]KRZ55000.1 hypothetical protein T02_4371 [Trichinella nativa]
MSFAFVESYSVEFVCAICHVGVINRTIACRTKSRQMLTERGSFGAIQTEAQPDIIYRLRELQSILHEV